MPIFTWVEVNSSRSATIHRLGRKATSTYVKSWKIFGTTNDLDVHNDVNGTLWNQFMFFQYPGQPLNRLQAESYTLEYLGDEAWQLQVTYTKDGAESDEQPEPVKRTRSFDTGGANQHITQGLTETAYGTNAPGQQMAIGVDGDSVRVGSMIQAPPYPRVHQHGMVIRPRSAKRLRFVVGGNVVFAKSVTIPARPWLGLSKANRKDTRDEVKAAVRAMLEGG